MLPAQAEARFEELELAGFAGETRKLRAAVG